MPNLITKTLAFSAVALIATPLLAQSDTKAVKADIVFELQAQKILDSELGKAFGWKEMLDQQGAALAERGEADPSKLTKVFAGIASPEKMDEIQGLAAGGGKLDFFVQMHFADASSAEAALKKPAEENSGVIEKNGKKYYKAPENQGMPPGAVVYRLDDTTVEMASEKFAYRASAAPLTDGIVKAWGAMPDEAIRLSIDGVQARTFLKELAAEGKKNAGGNPIAGAFFDLIPGMDSIGLSIDLSSKNLLTMTAVGADQSNADDMGDALQALLTMGVGPAKQGLTGLQQQDPDSVEVLTSLLDGIDVKKDGQTVTLSVPRPKGFEGTTQRLVRMLGPMLPALIPGLGGPQPAPF